MDCFLGCFVDFSYGESQRMEENLPYQRIYYLLSLIYYVLSKSKLKSAAGLPNPLENPWFPLEQLIRYFASSESVPVRIKAVAAPSSAFWSLPKKTTRRGTHRWEACRVLLTLLYAIFAEKSSTNCEHWIPIKSRMESLGFLDNR